MTETEKQTERQTEREERKRASEREKERGAEGWAKRGGGEREREGGITSIRLQMLSAKFKVSLSPTNERGQLNIGLTKNTTTLVRHSRSCHSLSTASESLDTLSYISLPRATTTTAVSFFASAKETRLPDYRPFSVGSEGSGDGKMSFTRLAISRAI